VRSVAVNRRASLSSTSASRLSRFVIAPDSHCSAYSDNYARTTSSRLATSSRTYRVPLSVTP
jgi:hypothetical protein